MGPTNQNQPNQNFPSQPPTLPPAQPAQAGPLPPDAIMQQIQPVNPVNTTPNPVNPMVVQPVAPAGPSTSVPQNAAALATVANTVGTAAQSGGVNQNPPAKPKTKPNSTQNTLQIAEIRDGIVIMNDGSFRSVVMVKSINFDLMSQQEQEAVEFSYQGFLNSLYFPVQIFIRSEKVDIQPYIDKLDKIRTEHDNMLLALLIEDYINYIDDLSQQTNIMDKKFYVVIPFFTHVDVQKALTQTKGFFTGLGALFAPKNQHVTINESDLEKAKTELRNRIQAVLGGLMQCGVQGLPLDTQELIELYYDAYNPDTATRQQLTDVNSLTADVVTKGEGPASQPHLRRELE